MTYSDAIVIRLKELCEARHITINKMATLAGISQSTLDNLLKKRSKDPRLKTLHKIAVGMEMTISEFLDFPEMNETIFEDE